MSISDQADPTLMTAKRRARRRIGWSSPVVVLASLALGVAVGAVLRPRLNASGVSDVIGGFEVIGTMWINAIRMTVIPLIVPLLLGSVVGTGSGRSVGALGLKTAAWFFGLLALAAIIAVPLGTTVFSHLSVDPATTAALRSAIAKSNPLPTGDASLAGFLKTLIPINPIKAAADGNLLSLLVFILAFGLATLAAPDAVRARVLAFTQTFSAVMLIVIQGVVALAPIGVFALTLVATVRLGGVVVSSLAWFVTLEVSTYLTTILCLSLLAMAWTKMTPRTFLSGAAPALLIAFGTSSSLSSLPAMIEGALDRWGLRTDVVGFVLPLAVSTFKLATGFSWVFMPVFVATLYGIHLGAAQFALIVGYAVFMNATVPGVPGGGVIAITPLFVALGLPLEGLAILFAVNAIVDRVATVLCVAGDMVVAAMVGDRPSIGIGIAIPELGIGR